MCIEAILSQHSCLLEESGQEYACKEGKGVGCRPGRLWEEPQDAEPHPLPLASGEESHSLHPAHSAADTLWKLPAPSSRSKAW